MPNWPTIDQISHTMQTRHHWFTLFLGSTDTHHTGETGPMCFGFLLVSLEKERKQLRWANIDTGFGFICEKFYLLLEGTVEQSVSPCASLRQLSALAVPAWTAQVLGIYKANRDVCLRRPLEVRNHSERVRTCVMIQLFKKVCLWHFLEISKGGQLLSV